MNTTSQIIPPDTSGSSPATEPGIMGSTGTYNISGISKNPETPDVQDTDKLPNEALIGGKTESYPKRFRKSEDDEVTLSTEKERAVLAILAAAGPNIIFGHTQLQMICFLANKEVHDELGKPDFHFEPHSNGPADRELDKQVHIMTLEKRLAEVAEVTSRHFHFGNRMSSGHMLTQKGYYEGVHTLEELKPKIKDYLERVAAYVLPMDFKTLICSVCHDSPEMGTNLTFPAWGGRKDDSIPKTPEEKRAARLEKMAQEKAQDSS